MTDSEFSFRRTIRDPIHGYIPVTALENKIIDSPAFQRLDRICQMHSVHLVYPNAKYSRKCHSLGAMHLIHQAFTAILYRQHADLRRLMPALFFRHPPVEILEGLDELDTLWPGWENDGGLMPQLTWVTQCVRLAGLLHDVGHAPFSHLFEHACREGKIPFDHEEMTRRIIREVLCQQEKLIDERTAKFVCQILGGQDCGLDRRMLFLHELISGPIDCDTMDYMSRDAYHAGALEYGNVNVFRWIQGLVVKGGVLKIEQDHVETLLSALHALLYLYDTVYYHKTCRKFDLAMLDALAGVPELLTQIASCPGVLLRYDDYCLLYEIRANQKLNYAEANLIVNDFLNRRKRYKQVASGNLNLTLDWVADRDGTFRTWKLAIKETIEKRYPGLNLRLDIKPQIRSVHLNPQKVLAWLRTPIVWSSDECQARRIRDVKETDVSRLRRMHVPVRVFLPLSQEDEFSEDQGRELTILLRDELRKFEDFYHEIGRASCRERV